jgi:hypothetical protein
MLSSSAKRSLRQKQTVSVEWTSLLVVAIVCHFSKKGGQWEDSNPGVVELITKKSAPEFAESIGALGDTHSWPIGLGGYCGANGIGDGIILNSLQLRPVSNASHRTAPAQDSVPVSVKIDPLPKASNLRTLTVLGKTTLINDVCWTF